MGQVYNIQWSYRAIGINVPAIGLPIIREKEGYVNIY